MKSSGDTNQAHEECGMYDCFAQSQAVFMCDVAKTMPLILGVKLPSRELLVMRKHLPHDAKERLCLGMAL